MSQRANFLLTGVAPAIWGSTYLVATEFFPHGYPITVAMLRALPAGLCLFLFVPGWPARRLWWRILVLGALNISVFLICLFVAAYRLPGGVAATVSATQPLFSVFLASVLLRAPAQRRSILAATIGMGGVALVTLTPQMALDPIGVVAGLVGAASMATGNVLARKWKSADVSLTAFTAWQLIAGGTLLVPLALAFEPSLPPLNIKNIGALLWLSLVGAALTYLIWFRGVVRLGPVGVSALLFLSPATAMLLGWIFLGQSLTAFQILGVFVIFASIVVSQNAQARDAQTRAK